MMMMMMMLVLYLDPFFSFFPNSQSNATRHSVTSKPGLWLGLTRLGGGGGADAELAPWGLEHHQHHQHHQHHHPLVPTTIPIFLNEFVLGMNGLLVDVLKEWE